jgi:hypothetical protein
MRLNISFKDNSDNESSFKIYRASNLNFSDKVEIISLSYSYGWIFSSSNNPVLKSSNSPPIHTGETFSIDFDEDETGSFFYGVSAYNIAGDGSSIESTLSPIQVGETTTLAPTTLAPTTLAPTTLAPTTLAPTTLAPTTLAPTTLPPSQLLILQSFYYDGFSATAGQTIDVLSWSGERPYVAKADGQALLPIAKKYTHWIEVVPTTLAPTTLAPTTLAPTTLAPTTLAPETICVTSS